MAGATEFSNVLLTLEGMQAKASQQGPGAVQS
jgi:hypothetical protein